MSLLPLYAVVFAGFVGYSLMITVFTPMIMSNHDLLLWADEPMSRRVILLGILLCLYPLGQFAGSPVLGALSDRFGRKPVLMISLCFTTGCYALIGIALSRRSSLSLPRLRCWLVWRKPTWRWAINGVGLGEETAAKQSWRVFLALPQMIGCPILRAFCKAGPSAALDDPLKDG
jgi:MFS family permease